MTSIKGIHYCLPPTRLTNIDLAQRFGASYVSRMEAMTGIKERRINGNTLDMAFWAATAVLHQLNISPRGIRCLILVSESGEYSIPSNAAILHSRLGMPCDAMAFDLSMGCPGFVYGLILANNIVRTEGGPVLLVNTDAITKFVHPSDRALTFLHGDGASAAVIGRGTGLRLEAYRVSTASSLWNTITLPNDQGSRYVSMDGVPVGHYVSRTVPDEIRDFLFLEETELSDLSLVLLHQANKYLIDKVYNELGLPDQKRFCFLETVGNLSNASSPVLLTEAWANGRIPNGSLATLTAFGAGLSCASVLLYNDGPSSFTLAATEQWMLEEGLGG